MIRMKRGDEQISFDAVIERIAPEVPRFVVYPGKAWDETGKFTVDVSLNGIPIGLRNLIPWKERGWHIIATHVPHSGRGDRRPCPRRDAQAWGYPATRGGRAVEE